MTKQTTHKSGASRLVMLILAWLSTSLIGCGPTPTDVGVPAAVLTSTVETTPVTSTALPQGTSTIASSPTHGVTASVFVPSTTVTPNMPPGTTTVFPTSTLPPPTPTNSPTATPYGGISEATVTIDTVTLIIRTPFLPSTTFGVASPGNALQVADSSSPNPFRALQIVVAPFGSIPGTESDRDNPLPAAQAGGAGAYRTKLREYKIASSGNPQSGPTATLFGQEVTSDASLLQSNLIYDAPKPTLYVEWVVEAGPRLWIVRIVKQLPAGTTDLSGEQSFLQSLESLTISSNTLNNPSTLTPYLGTPQAGENQHDVSFLFTGLIFLIAGLLIFGGVVLRRT